jgi:hypothetical protein
MPDSALHQGLPTHTGWRFFLEDPRTGQRRGFSNAVDLVVVLLTEFGYGATGEPPPSGDKAELL